MHLPRPASAVSLAFMKRLCVFCGSNIGARAAYAAAAKELGATLAQHKIGLVFGGGHIGLMGKVADAVLAEGGEVIGVIPEALVARELAHNGVTELRVVRSMHERKALMAELSDGFIALPGGFGTFEEFCEILTWAQLGLHAKPCGLLNIEGYFDLLLRLFDHAVVEKFLPAKHRGWVLEESDPAALLAKFRNFSPPLAEKWIDPTET
jgi:uncharacterized protein (TIGR00730 family)